MTKPHPLDEQITEAWDELVAARNALTKTLNTDTIRDEIYAENRLNRLLERRQAAVQTKHETLAY